MPKLLIAVSALLLLPGCQGDAPSPAPRSGEPSAQTDKIVKIVVSASGEIQADGKPVTLEALADQLAALRAKGGAVWYYRENPAAEPHPNAEQVINLIAENGLPVRLSTKPDFSDSAGEDGVVDED